MSTPIVPAALAFKDGTPYAEAYADVYHASDGGLEQARHVFLAGNGLPQRWQGRETFCLLETGFGLGLNFLATWQAWRADPQRSKRLHYLAIEKHPFRVDDLERLHARWPELAELAQELRAHWPRLTPGLHRLLLDEGRVSLTLVFGDVVDWLAQVDGAFDAFYLDGFAPERNPDMWSASTLNALKKLAAPESTAASYAISGPVREALTAAGFRCRRQPGFGRKWHMLTARFEPRWPVTARSAPEKREAIVIGAGIAGSSMAQRLCARGWRVTLIERHAGPAQEASGNRAGIVKPLPSRDDNLVSRFTRTAFLFSLELWQRIGGIGTAFTGAASGILQLATDAEDAATQAAVARGVDAELLHWLDSDAVRAHAGIEHPHGGWLFAQGAWVEPPSLCAALLASCGELLERRFATAVSRLDYRDGLWQVQDAQGTLIACAPTVIIANGRDAVNLAQTAALPLAALRGQVTHIAAGLLPPLALPLCGDGYLVPAPDGSAVLGASFDEDGDAQLRQDSQDENLRHLAALLPHHVLKEDLPLAGRVGFRSYAPDRMPLAGALPDMDTAIAGSRLRDVARLPGMYGLLGLGSRGMTWAPLLAELLAAQIEGEPAPLEKRLIDAVDPARFALRAHRQAGG